MFGVSSFGVTAFGAGPKAAVAQLPAENTVTWTNTATLTKTDLGNGFFKFEKTGGTDGGVNDAYARSSVGLAGDFTLIFQRLASDPFFAGGEIFGGITDDRGTSFPSNDYRSLDRGVYFIANWWTFDLGFSNTVDRGTYTSSDYFVIRRRGTEVTHHKTNDLTNLGASVKTLNDGLTADGWLSLSRIGNAIAVKMIDDTVVAKVTITAAPAIDAFTSTAPVKIRVKASAAPALGLFTGNAVEKTLVKASSAPGLGLFTSAGSVKVRTKASAAPALAPFTTSSSATVVTSAPRIISGAPSLGLFTGSSLSKVRTKASVSGVIQSFTLGSNLKSRLKTSVSVSLGSFTSSSQIKARLKSSSTASLGTFLVSGNVGGRIKLTGSPMLGAFTGTSEADVRLASAGSVDIGEFTSTGSVRVHAQFSSSTELGEFTCAGTIDQKVKISGSSELGGFRCLATIGAVQLPVTGSISAQLGVFTSTSQMRVRDRLKANGLLDSFSSMGGISVRELVIVEPEPVQPLPRVDKHLWFNKMIMIDPFGD